MSLTLTIGIASVIGVGLYLFRSSKLSFLHHSNLNQLPISYNQTKVKFIDYLRHFSKQFDAEHTYYPTFWLNNAILQMFYLGYAHKLGKKVSYQRQLFGLEDGGEVGLDWYPKRPQPESTKPIVLILHMVASNSRERNCRELVLALTKEGRFDCVVFNFRGSGGVALRTPKLYNAGLTGDLREIVTMLDTDFKNCTKFAVGFSLGANLLTNYVGEFNGDTKLQGFVSVGNPYSITKSSKHVSTTWAGKNILGPHLTGALTLLFRKHVHVFKGTDIVERKWVLLHEFDNDVTAKAFGFKDAFEYYKWAGCDKHIHNVTIPSLFISSLDDPIVPETCIPYQKISENEHILLVTSELGSHVGWWTGHTKPKIHYIPMVTDYLTALDNVCKKDVPKQFVL